MIGFPCICCCEIARHTFKEIYYICTITRDVAPDYPLDDIGNSGISVYIIYRMFTGCY